MKFTINGFSQKRLLKYGMDTVDALLLRYFIDYKDSGKMISKYINNKQYFWIKYESVYKEIPISGLNKNDSVYRRLRRMVKAEILESVTVRQGGVYSFYTTGKNYYNLLSDDNFYSDTNPNATDTNPTFSDSNPTSTDTNPTFSDENPEQKINLLNNKSINNKSINNTSDKIECKIEFKLSEYLFKLIKKNNPDAKKPNFVTWGKHMDYLLRLDKRNPEQVKQVITFCQNDDFWYKNILSPDKLRKHYDKLLLKMNDPRKQSKKDGPITNFNNYDQRSYDYDALEKKLLGWDK
ncbi:hypothetical protein OSC52_15425 [Clostridium pasteurianum]|uniref:hypothetical protein n=1 Tax=Clostridium pasteurianum TaxID=1501 RepID=UPI002260850D|nr:hypothetical protein [Clostridium pasteurianum]UZW13227.1 hypothetical protein OSC52_15425 [Clostridium pasteurianum]